jgi:hypothetical protein
MSAFAGPARVTNGLVFDMDMSNTNKSWRGAPTTNLTPDMGVAAVQSVTVTYVGIEDGWKKYSLNGTWTAGTYPYSISVDSVSFTGGVTYSTGVYVKTNVPSKFASLFTGMNYVNQPQNIAGTSFSIPQSDGSIYVGRYGFQYTSTTSQPGYLLSQPNINQVFSSSTDFVYIKNGQIETGSFTTPYVNGTRSTTQALVDLTGRNTLTASSLTYESGGEFNFNGSGNYIDVTGSGFTSGMATYTIAHWSRRDVESRMPVAGRTSTAFYQYGDNSWYYTHGGVAAEYYYPRVASIPLGTWGFYCIVYNGSNVAIYRNGYLEGTQATTGTADWSQGLRIGYWSAGGGYAYSGKIGSVKFYNRNLSAAEVTQEFNALRGRYGL